MMNKTTINKILRAIFFSFVTGPALALFITLVLCTMSSGSLSAQYLKSATQLTHDSPAGMVSVCQRTERNLTVPPVKYVAEPCNRKLVSADSLALKWDSALFAAYRTVGILSLLIWLGINPGRETLVALRERLKP